MAISKEYLTLTKTCVSFKDCAGLLCIGQS